MFTKYIISNNGAGIAIGLLGNKEETLCDAILAENIYGSNHSDEYFDHMIFMKDTKQFKKFLCLKEYFKIWDEHWTRNRVAKTRTKPNIMQFTRRAIKRAKLIIESSVTHENFMQQISNRNQEYSVGFYQDEREED